MSKPNLHFVISSPRSGSTWLSRALNGHPDVFATEQRLFGNFCEMWPTPRGDKKPRITVDAFAKAFGVHYFHEELGMDRTEFENQFHESFVDFLLDFAARRTDAKTIIDKITPYTGTTEMVINKIRERIPQAKIIHLVRDGRDTVTSATFDWLLMDAKGTDRHRFFVEKSLNVMDRFFDDAVLQRWAKHWNDVNQTTRDAKPDLEVRFETMKEDQATVLKNIFQLLSLDTSDEIAQQAVSESSFEKATGRQPGEQQATSKTRNGIVGDWKNYFTRADGELFNQLAGTELARFDYAENSDWIQTLPEKLGREQNEVPSE